ncbi:MAG: DUF6112 family protein [Pseudoclavibacter sp.]
MPALRSPAPGGGWVWGVYPDCAGLWAIGPRRAAGGALLALVLIVAILMLIVSASGSTTPASQTGHRCGIDSGLLHG